MTSVARSRAPQARPFCLDIERDGDVVARERLLDAAMGPERFRKTSERLRAGRKPALAMVARDETGRLIGTVRLWHVAAGGRAALLLGPLAVDAARRCDGVGGALMRAAIAAATQAGHGAILLVGDAPYYTRFGFARAPRVVHMPGPVELDRFLALELRAGALDGAEGRLVATGERAGRRRATRKAAHARAASA
mgnify:CR=1 FL=1